jgi:hypothetical protein
MRYTSGLRQKCSLSPPRSPKLQQAARMSPHRAVVLEIYRLVPVELQWKISSVANMLTRISIAQFTETEHYMTTK